MPETYTIIGVDCATVPKNVGLSLGTLIKKEGSVSTRIEIARTATENETPAAIITQWLSQTKAPVLLALDAPLGWPAKLGTHLLDHQAGAMIDLPPNMLFRRETDRFIKQAIGKQPLDVGADRIARTAHAALKLLSELAWIRDGIIPLAWSPQKLSGVHALEVYPAASLRARSICSSGYKKSNQMDRRLEIIQELKSIDTLSFSPGAKAAAVAIDHCLDAALCVLAAGDFLAEKAMPPKDLPLAMKEGWIWVRRINNGDQKAECGGNHNGSW